MATSSGTWSTAHTGKGKFIARLIEAMEKIGATVTTNPDESVDVDLQITKKRYNAPNAKVKVVRVGPVTYDTRVSHSVMNADTRTYMKQCDGIIYQSAFSKQACDSIIWKPKHDNWTICLNGADPEYYNAIEPFKVECKHLFLASTREWVWEKRLRDIIKAFKTAAIPDSNLYVLGRVWEKEKRFDPSQKKTKDKDIPGVRFLGECNDDTIAKLLRRANALLHGVYIDACPNAVAEALCAGCPVIMCGCGGQFEMVDDDYRYACKQEWNFKPRDRRDQPPLAGDWMAEAMRQVIEQPPSIDTSRVNINNIAEQYLSFFENLLCQ